MTDIVSYLQDQVNAQYETLWALERAGDSEAIHEWIGDALDIKLTVTSSVLVDDPAAYMGRKVSVMVTFGGPNVYVDLDHDESQMLTVRGYWGTESAERSVRAPLIAQALNDTADLYMGMA